MTDVYLLQGLIATETTLLASEEIERRELSVFRSVKILLGSYYKDKELNITVFSYNTQKVLSTDQVEVSGSGIIGLIGSLAKEQPMWHIRMIDLDSRLISGLEIANILSTLYPKEGSVVSYRKGHRYERSLYPIELSDDTPTQLIQGGTYVILGGTGGLGKVTTSYLVKKYAARVIWLGRRPLDETIKASQDEITKLGQRPEYIQCDANDIDSVERAYKAIKLTHDSVHGIIHSGIVLNDMLLKNMSEDDFKKSFTLKSIGSHHLVEVFREEPLDFVCFYSSVQSQWNSAGQSNYSAGCTYKDSFALSLVDRFDIPFHIINWGYWGEVGVVSKDIYRDRMKKMGIGSITPIEGMRILEITLANRKTQVAAIKFI